MPLRLDIKKKLSTRTDRVKSVDISTNEPWVLIGLYTGHLQIWNYDTQQLVKDFEVADQTPIRFARFITRKQWIICGSDDMMIRVYNVHTMEKLREFEAHLDYIRSLDIHPNHPYVLTSSDDMQIKLWDWDRNWSNVQQFDGHSHYVMQVKFNPKDTNSFASASLDRSIKVWSLSSNLPNFSLEGHTAGVNCLDYFLGGDKPYLASGSDDHTVKIWDYQTKACVYTLQQHTNNVSAVIFHPSLPIILSGSEDGTVRVWHSTTYRLENTLNYGMERCWCLGASSFSNKLALGFDEGVVVLQMGREMPVVSMDSMSGKILLATTKDIQAGAIGRGGEDEDNVKDGDVVEISTWKSAGALELQMLQLLEHNSNGRFVSLLGGDGEYVIYTSQALRNKSFGQALDFVWSSRSPNDYATRDASNKVHIFTDFKETSTFTCQGFTAEQLFGGYLVGVAGGGGISFYNWDSRGGSPREIVRVDVMPQKVFWSEDGTRLALCCEESMFVLQVNQDLIERTPEGMVEAAFEYLDEIPEQAKYGEWIPNTDVFLYISASGPSHRLQMYVGGEVTTIAHLDREHVLLGYLPAKNRIYLMDKAKQVVSYQVLFSVMQYQTLICRGEFDKSAEMIGKQVPLAEHEKISRFLEAKGLKELALEISTDMEHKFELALQLERFTLALEIMRTQIDPSSAAAAGVDKVVSQDIASKWKQLGDLALSRGNVELAEECSLKAQDFSSLLLLYSSMGRVDKLEQLTDETSQRGLANIAFCSALMARDYPKCCEVLIQAKRIPEASFFALNHCPSKVSDLVTEWKREMQIEGHGLGKRIAKALADPTERPDLFPGFAEALEKEKAYNASLKRGSSSSSSSSPRAPATAVKPAPSSVTEKRVFAETAPATVAVVEEPQQKQAAPISPRPVVESPKAQPKVESPRALPVVESPKAQPIVAPAYIESPTAQANKLVATQVVDDLVQDAIQSSAGASETEQAVFEGEDEEFEQELDKEVEGLEAEEETGNVEDDLALEEDWE